MSMRAEYTYRVVTSGGCVINGGEWLSYLAAKAAADEVRKRFPDAEVERVRCNSNGSRTYFLRRGERWIVAEPPWEVKP